MDRLSSSTLPIIEYGGGQAIRLYAMWTILEHFSTLQPSASACQHGASAFQLVSLWYLVIGRGRAGC